MSTIEETGHCGSMHPWTLRFYDDDLEAELRAAVLKTNHILQAVVFSISIFSAVKIAGFSVVIVVVLQVASLGAWVMIFLANSHAPPNLHWTLDLALVEKLWLSGWIINVGVWWIMRWHGGISRIDPDETERMLACAAMWMFVMVTQRVLHINPWHRAFVTAVGLTIILSGDVWQQLLSGLVLGELEGYTLEKLLRDRFLDRAMMIEQLRKEKERRDYDLALAYQRHPPPRGLASVSSESSYGTNSELASYGLRQQNTRRSASPVQLLPVPDQCQVNDLIDNWILPQSQPSQPQPQASQPQASQPQASQPQASQPQASQPQPQASQPQAPQSQELRSRPPSRPSSRTLRQAPRRLASPSPVERRPVVGRRLAGGLP